MELAERFDEVIVLEKGTVVEQGTPELLNTPGHAFWTFRTNWHSSANPGSVSANIVASAAPLEPDALQAQELPDFTEDWHRDPASFVLVNIRSTLPIVPNAAMRQCDPNLYEMLYRSFDERGIGPHPNTEEEAFTHFLIEKGIDYRTMHPYDYRTQDYQPLIGRVYKVNVRGISSELGAILRQCQVMKSMERSSIVLLPSSITHNSRMIMPLLVMHLDSGRELVEIA
jgi:hypothetical protein